MNLARIQQRMSGLKGWTLEINAIVKECHFPDFKQSIEFVNKIAELAEKRNHHPSILIDYNLVRLTLTTHSDGGLTDKDFDFAEEIEKL
jgi:4a-hydroxytetrahydrobiopterin dehydratase